jgi:flagellar basal-body rod protein FlgF
MDRLVYVAMSGAKETLRAQAANNHNLANANTNGFKADLSAFQTQSVTGAGLASRAYATNDSAGWDASSGQ